MFENNENFVNAGQEGVVDLPNTDLETSAVEDTQSTSENVANSQPNGNNSQSKEENHAFARMRKKNESFQSDNLSLVESLKKLGYQGTPEEIAQKIAIEQSGMTEEEYQKQETAFEERLNRDPRMIEAMKVTKEARFKEDLQAIKSAYPDCNAESVEEIGDVFLSLMRTGQISAVDAYAAQLAHNERERAKVPPEIGAVNTTAMEEKGYYSSEDADNYTTEDLINNPALLNKIKKSMKKW